MSEPPRKRRRRHTPNCDCGGNPADLPAFKCGHHGHHNSAGQLCGQNVVRGTEHCRNHAGIATDVHKAKGEVVLEFQKWTLSGHDGSNIDHRKVILDMISFWVWKCDQLSTWQHTEQQTAGGADAVDEGFWLLADHELKAHKHLANLCSVAGRLNIEQQKIDMAREYGLAIQDTIVGVLTDLGVKVTEQVVWQTVVKHMDRVAARTTTGAAA